MLLFRQVFPMSVISYVTVVPFYKNSINSLVEISERL